MASRVGSARLIPAPRSKVLLSRGTIRVGIGIPEGADFELTAVDDPYGFASAAQLSLFRRPLPATNLGFGSVVMWDGRTTGVTLQESLGTQANGATQGHAQRATPLDQATVDEIVAFETGLFTAQIVDHKVGRLDLEGAHGDAEDLAGQRLGDGRWDLSMPIRTAPIPGVRRSIAGRSSSTRVVGRMVTERARVATRRRTSGPTSRAGSST
jgi:hypothetical protein